MIKFLLKFHLKWWMNTNPFVQGMPVHPPDPKTFLYTDGNNGHSFRTDKSLKIYSPFLCHDFYRQHNSGLIYQQARRNTFSQPMSRGMEDPPMMPKTSYCHQDSSYPRQIQCFGRLVIENRQNSQNRVGIGSIDSEFNFPNVQLSQSGSVRNTFHLQTSILCIPNSGQSSLLR